MEITFITGEAIEDNDWKESYEILIDGKSAFRVEDGEPEDNTLCRNFNSVYGLQKIFETIHNSSKNGNSLEFSEVNI